MYCSKLKVNATGDLIEIQPMASAFEPERPVTLAADEEDHGCIEAGLPDLSHSDRGYLFDRLDYVHIALVMLFRL